MKRISMIELKIKIEIKISNRLKIDQTRIYHLCIGLCAGDAGCARHWRCCAVCVATRQSTGSCRCCCPDSGSCLSCGICCCCCCGGHSWCGPRHHHHRWSPRHSCLFDAPGECGELFHCSDWLWIAPRSWACRFCLWSFWVRWVRRFAAAVVVVVVVVGVVLVMVSSWLEWHYASKCWMIGSVRSSDFVMESSCIRRVLQHINCRFPRLVDAVSPKTKTNSCFFIFNQMI